MLAQSDVDGQVVQQTVQEEGRPQVRRVDQVVRAVRMFQQPRALVGRVVQHDVADAQHLHAKSVYEQVHTLATEKFLHLPFAGEFFGEIPQIGHRVGAVFVVERRIQFVLVLQRVARLRRAQFLRSIIQTKSHATVPIISYAMSLERRLLRQQTETWTGVKWIML